MPNLYGVANPNSNSGLVYTPGIANVPCPSGAKTTCFTTQMAASIPGDYYPMLWVAIDIQLGATAPTGLLVAFQLNGGSDVQGLGMAPGALVNNALYRFVTTFVGNVSYHFWEAAPPPTITVSVTPTAQAVTVLGASSSVGIQLLRGAD